VVGDGQVERFQCPGEGGMQHSALITLRRARSARLTSLPLLPSCSTKVIVRHRPAASDVGSASPPTKR
jgi:hypothetical protein